MTTHEIQTQLLMFSAQFAEGTTIWHKASGQAFVVTGYALDKNNELRLRCDPGSGGETLMLPVSMTTIRPASGGDDDE